jgi:hypothetical protein
VVVLPLPVGPVTSTMPALRASTSLRRASMGKGMPISSSRRTVLPWPSSRITTDSPYCEGSVDSRTSRVRSFRRSEKRPSCGRRFSEMSSPAISFRRGSASVCTCSTPSMRKRMRRCRSCGSMWMSDARERSACSNIELSNRTTGASSVVAVLRPSRSPISSSTLAMSAVSSRARPAITSPPRYTRSSAASRWLSATTARSISRRVRRVTSS